MNIIRICAAAVCPLYLFTACSILPVPDSTPVSYYDIGFPEKPYSGVPPLKINAFSGSVGNETKMVFRTGPNKISIDIYNQWSQSPSNLLHRYFILAFSGSETAPKYIIDGKILRFEGDLDAMQADIMIRVIVKNAADSKVVLNSVIEGSAPFKTKSASAFAEATGTAIADITRKLAEQIKALKKSK